MQEIGQYLDKTLLNYIPRRVRANQWCPERDNFHLIILVSENYLNINLKSFPDFLTDDGLYFRYDQINEIVEFDYWDEDFLKKYEDLYGSYSRNFRRTALFGETLFTRKIAEDFGGQFNIFRELIDYSKSSIIVNVTYGNIKNIEQIAMLFRHLSKTFCHQNTDMGIVNCDASSSEDVINRIPKSEERNIISRILSGNRDSLFYVNGKIITVYNTKFGLQNQIIRDHDAKYSVYTG